MPEELRTDQDVQIAARFLFDGCAPERRQDIDALWASFRPSFQFAPDIYQGQRFILDAGAYRYIRFNHRVLRAFWLAAFVAWEGSEAVNAALQTSNNPCAANFTRFHLLIEAFRSTLASDDPSLEPLPEGVPEPGTYPGADRPTSQAPTELATLAAGWAFLHEARHMKHQQEGTGAPQDGTSQQFHEEEFSCDEFAAHFLIDQHAKYAQDASVDVAAVLKKRCLGLCVAMFALVLMSEDNWEASDTHPSVQSRLDRIRAFLGADAEDSAMIIGAFMALRCIWPDVPTLAFA